MILHDFVMLGTTVPEPNSDGRVFVCSAGVSEEARCLVRIYPLARRSIPTRWGIYTAPLERNPRDSRLESWQIKGNREAGQHQWINARFDQVNKSYAKSKRATLLAPYVIGSIQHANAKRISLAIIQPDNIELAFEANKDALPESQLTLFDTGDDSEPGGARRFPWMPRVRFRDEGGRHDLMLRDWGVFELQRKHDEAYFLNHLESALSLSKDSSLLVGNMNNQRNTWLVISVLNGLREPASLFDAPTHEIRVPDAKRNAAYQRDGWKCVTCGASDHIDVVPADGAVGHVAGLEVGMIQTKCRACITGLGQF